MSVPARLARPNRERFPMKLNDSSVLVTGSNRGIGRALVAALLAHGVRRVYAAARDPKNVVPPAGAGDRVVPLALDVTDPAAIEAAAARAEGVTVVVNNAGSLASFGVLTSTPTELDHDYRTNVMGPLLVARAFAPRIEARGGGAIANVLSVVSLASMPALGGYSASKAAAYSVTQSLRAELAKKKIAVHAVFPGPVDTDMIKSFEMAKTKPEVVAESILRGIVEGRDEILPDPMAEQVYAAWTRDPQAIARQFAAM